MALTQHLGFHRKLLFRRRWVAAKSLPISKVMVSLQSIDKESLLDEDVSEGWIFQECKMGRPESHHNFRQVYYKIAILK